jgi:hypothetical protein
MGYVTDTEFVRELSESIRKILQDSREAKAVERAKVCLRLNLQLRFLTVERFTVTRKLELLAEVEAATTKQDIKDVVVKLREL